MTGTTGSVQQDYGDRYRMKAWRLIGLYTLILLSIAPDGHSVHHMSVRPPKIWKRQSDWIAMAIRNGCADTIHPGVTTQSGQGPDSTGFELEPGSEQSMWVSSDWQGRIWGRTNCSFNTAGTGPAGNSGGRACGTGDCNGLLQCLVTGDTPVTLAEFTLNAGDGQTYYDISLVDGYNLPMAIVMQPNGNGNLQGIPANYTNPSCEGTAGLLAPQDFSPYNGGSQSFLGTDSSAPLRFETELDDDEVSRWCPWSLQVTPPTEPSDGVYPYPDDNLQRQSFNPCFSACAKWNKPEDCCTGNYNSPSTCRPSEYSRAAKEVCPDAYSYAFDDQTSTFIIPAGAGFDIIFCPRGRSTDILATGSNTLAQLTQNQLYAGRN